jgi:hypothetical protein
MEKSLKKQRKVWKKLVKDGSKRSDKFQKNFDNSTFDFIKFERGCEEAFGQEAREASKHLRRTKKAKLTQQPDYGDLFTMKDFKDNVACGGFIDYDGYGEYATKEMVSDVTIYPSDIRANIYRDDFTHVMWYNR